MPLIRKSASDVTTYTRVNAISVTPVAPNLRRPATYAYSPRQAIPPITRASIAGAGASPGNTVLQVYGGVAPPAPPSPPVVVGPFGGSLYFVVVYNEQDPVSSWLRIEQTTLSPGTGDFTIAWWQNLSTDPYKRFPRLFCLGSDNLAVSFEGLGGTRTFYVWINGNAFGMGTVTIDNSWAHIAVVRKDSLVTAYVNGVARSSYVLPESITTTDDLLIGAHSLTPPIYDYELFEGNITNFLWITGYAAYTADFTPPLGNINAVPGTQLLLLADSFGTSFTNSGSGPVTVNSAGVAWSSANPD